MSENFLIIKKILKNLVVNESSIFRNRERSLKVVSTLPVKQEIKSYKDTSLSENLDG